VAFVLSGLLAFAYFIGHASKGFVLSPMLNGGEVGCVVLLCLFVLCRSRWRCVGH
jgi:putative oxidoreductase